MFFSLIMFFFLSSYVFSSTTIEIKWSNYFPVPSAQSKICEEFIKDIETYDAVLKKVIDGVYLPMKTMRAFRLGEAVKYITECWPVGEDVKKVFNEYPFEEKLANMWNKIDIDGKNYGKEKGLTYNEKIRI